MMEVTENKRADRLAGTAAFISDGRALDHHVEDSLGDGTIEN
jgi:hypothetical protein